MQFWQYAIVSYNNIIKKSIYKRHLKIDFLEWVLEAKLNVIMLGVPY